MCEREISLDDASLMEFDWTVGWMALLVSGGYTPCFSNCILQSFRFFHNFSLEGGFFLSVHSLHLSYNPRSYDRARVL